MVDVHVSVVSRAASESPRYLKQFGLVGLSKLADQEMYIRGQGRRRNLCFAVNMRSNCIDHLSDPAPSACDNRNNRPTAV